MQQSYAFGCVLASWLAQLSSSGSAHSINSMQQQQQQHVASAVLLHVQSTD